MNKVNDNKYYLGIDVGGTSVKGGVVKENGEILFKATSRYLDRTAIEALDFVMGELARYCKDNGISAKECGIGVPCVFDKVTGQVSYGNNLDFKGVNLKEYFLEKYGVKVSLSNDAAAAALGEYRFGAGIGHENLVLITVGTGIGCGVILGGKPILSNSSAVGELGHTIVQAGGRKCGCGGAGCLEAYCSMTALYKDVKREMLKNKQSALWKTIDPNAVDGKKFFDCVGKDQTADKVYRRFIKYLGIGVLNVANFIRPDKILIGGAVSAQGEKIIKPLQEFLDNRIFAKEYTSRITVGAAQNGNDAGILGAAAVVM